MKAGSRLLFVFLSFAVGSEAQTAEAVPEFQRPSSSPAVRGRIMELLKQDVMKIPAEMKESIAPFSNTDSTTHDQPVAEGVLELETLTITKKRVIELPLIPKLTLENFFYGDGKIAESAGKRVSLSAGPERRGLAALKINIKF